MYDKKFYKELTNRVAKIDKGAARYMRKHAPKELLSFTYEGALTSCFVWSDTPQGHGFWENVYDKLRGDM